jgi:hypothetical protein
MTKHQIRYFSRKTQQVRVNQLIKDVQNHPHYEELLTLIEAQKQDDTYRQGREVVYA